MSTENRQLFGGPHDGTRVLIESTGQLAVAPGTGFMQDLTWNVVPVRAVVARPEGGWEVYGSFDGPHLYMEDSEGRLSHVPPAMTGALRIPATLQ